MILFSPPTDSAYTSGVGTFATRYRALGLTLLAACSGESSVISDGGVDARAGGAPAGAPCTPDEEQMEYFRAIRDSSSTGAWRHRLRITHLPSYHFQGRTTCPYGQMTPTMGPDLPEDQYCHLAGAPADADHRVLRRQPACKSRRASRAVFCTCRCGGKEGDANYCSCPTGTHCVRDVNISIFRIPTSPRRLLPPR